MITDTETLAEFCTSLGSADFVTVDTEFMRESTYWPKLCLVQLAGPEPDQLAAVDTLAPGLDLAPLFALLQNPDVPKVFHAARQDIEIFVHLNNQVPDPFYDTQMAAMVLGFGDQVGYEALVNKVANAGVDKSMRFTDWSQRPLSQKQIDYALSDVTHLRVIHAQFQRRLAENGRARWLDEEMARQNDPALYRTDPNEAWRRLKTRSSSPRFLAVVRELAKWREEEAQRKNLPRARILRDDVLMDLAARKPLRPEDLNRTRGMGKNFGHSPPGRAVMACIQTALDLPKSALPTVPQMRERPSGTGPTVDLLKVLLKLCCEEAGVAQRLVATADDLQSIAAFEDQTLPALNGWRYRLFGKQALQLKRGEIALSLQNGQVIALPVSGIGHPTSDPGHPG